MTNYQSVWETSRVLELIIESIKDVKRSMLKMKGVYFNPVSFADSLRMFKKIALRKGL